MARNADDCRQPNRCRRAVNGARTRSEGYSSRHPAQAVISPNCSLKAVAAATPSLPPFSRCHAALRRPHRVPPDYTQLPHVTLRSVKRAACPRCPSGRRRITDASVEAPFDHSL